MGKIWQLSETFDVCLKHLLNFWHRWGGTSVPFTRKQPIHVTWWCAIIHDQVGFWDFHSAHATPTSAQITATWSMQLRLPYSNTEQRAKRTEHLYIYIADIMASRFKERVTMWLWLRLLTQQCQSRCENNLQLRDKLRLHSQLLSQLMDWWGKYPSSDKGIGHWSTDGNWKIGGLAFPKQRRPIIDTRWLWHWEMLHRKLETGLQIGGGRFPPPLSPSTTRMAHCDGLPQRAHCRTAHLVQLCNGCQLQSPTFHCRSSHQWQCHLQWCRLSEQTSKYFPFQIRSAALGHRHCPPHLSWSSSNLVVHRTLARTLGHTMT